MLRKADGDAKIKIDEKKKKIPVRLVLSQVPFKSGVWNKAYKMPKYVLSLLVKPKLKNLLSVLCYRLSRFRGKAQNKTNDFYIWILLVNGGHILAFYRHNFRLKIELNEQEFGPQIFRTFSTLAVSLLHCFSQLSIN